MRAAPAVQMALWSRMELQPMDPELPKRLLALQDESRRQRADQERQKVRGRWH